MCGVMVKGMSTSSQYAAITFPLTRPESMSTGRWQSDDSSTSTPNKEPSQRHVLWMLIPEPGVFRHDFGSLDVFDADGALLAHDDFSISS